MSWLLNIIYATLLFCLSPVILWRNIRHGRYRQGWKEKLFGTLPQPNSDRAVVWFHAVSVGEIVQLQKVVAEFRTQTEDVYEVVVTTSTDTGYELAVDRFGGCTVAWFPLDFSWAVRKAIRRVHPAMVVLMELELWPNFLTTCAVEGIPTALINARMSDRSFRGYSRIRRLIAPIFEHFAVVGTQTEEYADRLRILGCTNAAVRVTGSVKFDGATTDRTNPATAELKRLFNITDEHIVLIAGSTQDPEERAALDAWISLRGDHSNLRLILVPRHQERFESVALVVTTAGVDLCRRSELTSKTEVSNHAVILLDTIGELSACWGLSDIAFVGGSFGSRGGQNMLEPAAYGAAVLYGPNTWNFGDIVHRLDSAHASVLVPALSDLQSAIQRLIEQPTERKLLGMAAQNVVLAQRGAIGRTVSLLIGALS